MWKNRCQICKISQMCNFSKYAQNLHKICTFNWFVQAHTHGDTCFMAVLWPFFLESYTPGQVSALKYVLVCTWYAPWSVQGSTIIKENGVFKYVLSCTLSAICSSTYRNKLSLNFTIQISFSYSTYWYILVHTCMYQYVPVSVCICLYQYVPVCTCMY